MKKNAKDIKKKDNKYFGFILSILIFFILIFNFFLLNNKIALLWFLLPPFLIILSFVMPNIFYIPCRILNYLVSFIHPVISNLLVLFLFYFVVGPISFIYKMINFKKDKFKLKFKENYKSNWKNIKKEYNLESFIDLF